MINKKNDFTEILGSKGKTKILLLLAKHGQLNITKIVKYSGLHYNLVKKHLDDLLSLGLIEEQRIGKIRIFSLKFDNPKVPLLLELIRSLEEV
jgi:DNA-binding transcriptional ArsR family regulator